MNRNVLRIQAFAFKLLYAEISPCDCRVVKALQIAQPTRPSNSRTAIRSGRACSGSALQFQFRGSPGE